jgi:hypothetical protein
MADNEARTRAVPQCRGPAGKAATAVVHVGPDTVRHLALGARYGVRLAATRDSMAYVAPGLGHGAANLRVVLTRGLAADTIVVSRLGRVR